MSTYELIRDTEELAKLVDVLPETTLHEKYLICLFSRKKYANNGKDCPSESLLKRTLCEKDEIVRTIRQLEIKRGYYVTNKSVPVPEESLAVYINPNPRCLRKAQIATIKKLVDRIDDGQFCNPKSVAMSCIHRSKSRAVFVDFDIDDKTQDLSVLDSIFPDNKTNHYYKILETRGGYHVLVFLENLDCKINKSWYNDVRKLLVVDQCGDELIPVPGCIQGGFVPKFIG